MFLRLPESHAVHRGVRWQSGECDRFLEESGCRAAAAEVLAESGGLAAAAEGAVLSPLRSDGLGRLILLLIYNFAVIVVILPLWLACQ